MFFWELPNRLGPPKREPPLGGWAVKGFAEFTGFPKSDVGFSAFCANNELGFC